MAKRQPVGSGSGVWARPRGKQGFLYDHHCVIDKLTNVDMRAGCPYWMDSFLERIQRVTLISGVSEISLEVLGLVPKGEVHVILGPVKEYALISTAIKNLRRSRRVHVFNTLPVQFNVDRICKALGASNSGQRHDYLVEQAYKDSLCSGIITHASFLKGWQDCPTAKKQRAMLAGKNVKIDDYRRAA